jgi:hypothetical protein
MANQAAWIDAEFAPIRVGEAEKYEVEPHTILVKNMCIAFNPMEAKIQKSVTQSIPTFTPIQPISNSMEFEITINLSSILDTPSSPKTTPQSSAGPSLAS